MKPYVTMREEIVNHVPRPSHAVRRHLRHADRRRDMRRELVIEAKAEEAFDREMAAEEA